MKNKLTPNEVRGPVTMAGYVYILTNQRHTVLYIGSTGAIAKRIRQHRSGNPGSFSVRYNLDKVVYFQKYQTIHEARQAERKIKGWTRAKKNALINGVNPGWRELMT